MGKRGTLAAPLLLLYNTRPNTEADIARVEDIGVRVRTVHG